MMELLAALEASAFTSRRRRYALRALTQRSRGQAMGPAADTPAAFKMIGGVSLLSWFMVLYWGRMLPFAVGSSF